MPRRTPPTTEATEMDYCRLAAFIDGEGSILLNKFARHKARPGGGQDWDIWLRVTIINTDPRLLVWCREHFGGRITIHNPNKGKPHHKNSFNWTVNCRQAAETLERCMPYFLVKREQAEIALAFQATRTHSGRRWLNESEREARLKMREDLAQLRAKEWSKESIEKEYSELVN